MNTKGNSKIFKVMQICCVCIHTTSKSCSSATEFFIKKGFEEIKIFKILQILNLLHYEVNFFY